MSRQNERGFAHTILIIALAIVALGATGYAVKVHHDATSNVTAASPTPQVTITSTPQLTADQTAIKTNVLAFYTAYNAQLITQNKTASSTSPDYYAWQHLAGNTYISAGLATSLSRVTLADVEPVICAQSISVSPFTIDTIAVTGNTASAIVRQQFDPRISGEGSEIGVKLAKNNDNWQLTDIVCVPPQAQ